MVEERADGVDVGAQAGDARSCSGGTSPGVPSAAPARVSSARVSKRGAASSVMSASARSLAGPQAMTMVSPNSPTMTLEGSRSRWMMPRAWA
jgi:hypothetical protein